MSLPFVPEYVEAMEKHGQRKAHIDITIEGLLAILTSLQLALQHPEYPGVARGFVEEFIEGCTAKIYEVSPVIANVVYAGNDSTQDDTLDD